MNITAELVPAAPELVEPVVVEGLVEPVAGEQLARRPGRPRDLRAEQAILDATLELLVRDGLNALSLSAVATRAGVGKATIYRWWSGKDDLVVDTLATLTPAVAVASTGDLRADLMTALSKTQNDMSQTLAGQALPRVMGEASDALQLLYWERVVVPQRQGVSALLAAGVASGELAEHDPEIIMDMLLGPIVMGQCMAAAVRPCGARDVGVIVDTLLHGLRRSP